MGVGCRFTNTLITQRTPEEPLLGNGSYRNRTVHLSRHHSERGFLDGMGLATAAGLCWKKMVASIGNFKSAAGTNILHVGGRDFYPEEQALFEKAGGSIIPAAVIREASMREALEQPSTI